MDDHSQGGRGDPENLDIGPTSKFPKRELGLDKRRSGAVKMRIISKKTLKDFWEKEPSVKGALEAWHSEAKNAEWSTPAEVKARYATASILKDGRVVFNIGGNKYRLVVWINYEFFTVYIRFVGTHKDYDEIDAQTI